MSRAKHWRVFVQNHGNGDPGKYLGHRPLVGERAAEAALLQFWKDLYRDTASQKHSAVRQNAQGQIPGVRAKRVDPPIKYLGADTATAIERIVSNFACGNGGRFAKSGMGHRGIEKFVQSPEALPGKDVLAGNAVEILLQEQQKACFALITRSKISGSTFRRSGAMALPIPVKHRLAKAGSCGNYRFVAARVGYALLQRQEVPGRKSVQAERSGNQIVQQHHIFLRKIQHRGKGG